MMLQRASRKRLTLSLLTFISIVGFGLLLVSRFNATNITPASNAVQGSPQEIQAEPLQATDKTELAKTDLIKVTPSEKVKSAEQAMPKQGSRGYHYACQNMKRMYTEERNDKLQAEAKRFAAAQQEITNKYNREGRSFSLAEKLAHTLETRRHEIIVKQINEQYRRQLTNLSC
jgi:hypothetical protein